MKMLFGIALAAVLAVQAPMALADTIYKCVDAGGKVAFSSRPCDGQSKQARQLAVPPPEADDVSAARLKLERQRLELDNAGFKRRQALRDADLPRPQRRVAASAPKASAAAQKAQEQANQRHIERQEAARLNAARIGNCTTRRPEAGCL